MSSQTCQAGDTQGFPIRLSQKLTAPWPGVANAATQLQKLVAPIDFSVNWAPSAPSQISVSYSSGNFFQIRGFDTMAGATTLTLGGAQYSCASVVSVTKILHPNFSDSVEGSQYEAILAFTIRNRDLNPSSPHIILLCRPLRIVEGGGSSMWVPVNESARTGSAKNGKFDIGSLFRYANGVMLPMASYQTCLNTKLINPGGDSLGSLRVKVCVCMDAMEIPADTDGVGKCSNVPKYLLTVEPRRLADLMPNNGPSSIFQFKDGIGTGGFPNNRNNNFFPMSTSSILTDFNSISSILDLLVPNEFLGKSFTEITTATTPPKPKSARKAYKCYKVDPDKDIKDDKILVDPETGQRFADMMKEDRREMAGGDPQLQAALEGNGSSSGLMPGDIQNILVFTFTGFGALILLAYLGFIAHTIIYRKDYWQGIIHGLIFGGTLTGLVIFAIFFGGE